MKITYKDVMKLAVCSGALAQKRMSELRKACGKVGENKHQDITLRDFCNHYGYDYQDGLDLLGR